MPYDRIIFYSHSPALGYSHIKASKWGLGRWLGQEHAHSAIMSTPRSPVWCRASAISVLGRDKQGDRSPEPTSYHLLGELHAQWETLCQKIKRRQLSTGFHTHSHVHVYDTHTHYRAHTDTHADSFTHTPMHAHTQAQDFICFKNVLNKQSNHSQLWQVCHTHRYVCSLASGFPKPPHTSALNLNAAGWSAGFHWLRKTAVFWKLTQYFRNGLENKTFSSSMWHLLPDVPMDTLFPVQKNNCFEK